MRHIPEDELHAYLDQALSRSQCVEIECHLAACVLCRHERDQIAGLRDRTTALLGLLAPPARPRPVLAELQLAARGRQASAQAAGSGGGHARGARWTVLGRRAAGLMLAIAVGWSARGLIPGVGDVGVAPGPSTTAAGAPNLAFGGIFGGGETLRPQLPATSAPAPGWQPDPAERRPAAVARLTAPAGPQPLTMTVQSAEGADGAGEFVTAGVWRTVSWPEASALTGDAVPRISGLPVLEVLIQSIGPEQRPLVMVVHQDPQGRLVRTIEGPVEEVADLVSGEISRSGGQVRSSSPVRSAPDYVGAGTDDPWRSIRVVTVAGRQEAPLLESWARSLTMR